MRYVSWLVGLKKLKSEERTGEIYFIAIFLLFPLRQLPLLTAGQQALIAKIVIFWAMRVAIGQHKGSVKKALD